MMIKKRKVELYNLLKKYIGPDKEDLVHSVYEVFLKRKYVESFDPEKSSFKTFVNNWSKFIMKTIHLKTKYLNKVELLEGFNDVDKSPSICDMIIEKEYLAEIFDYFTDEELNLMNGNTVGADLARKKGITRQAVSIKLRDKVRKFKENQ